jgi:hypothetical protein
LIVQSLATAATVVLAAVYCMKIVAYVVDIGWLRFGRIRPANGEPRVSGASILRADYHQKRVRERRDDIELGRPRLFSRTADEGKGNRLQKVLAFLFRTPTLVLLALTLFALESVAADWALAFASVSLCALTIIMLVAALVTRLTLGPLDQFNPDLRVPTSDKGFLAPQSSALGRYLLVLIGLTVISFSVIYSLIYEVSPGSFDMGTPPQTDVTAWLYFSATIASTVGFGDFHAASPLGRVAVLAQLGAGTILVTWIAAVFLGEEAPPEDAGSHSG